ncbi:MAG: chromosomal replication initiator DnaA [Pseudomonadota bacterium]
MAEQLGLDMPSIAAMSRGDFLVAPCNALALAQIENWQDWTAGKLLLCGPSGSGKTHLAHVWADLTDAKIVSASALCTKDIPAFAGSALVVEDVHLIDAQPALETALFHLHNLIQAEGHALLLSGTGRPADWGISLPDLASRLLGTQTAVLDPPDDTLLASLLAKLFSDRQLAPAPNLIEYLMRRMDRSFAAAGRIVTALDAESLAQKKPITRSFAARVLDKIGLQP